MLSNEDALLAANAHHLLALFRADVPSRDRLSFAELTKTFRKLKLLPVGHPPPRSPQTLVAAPDLRQLVLRVTASPFPASKTPPPMSFPQFKSLVKEVASTAFPDLQEPIR